MSLIETPHPATSAAYTYRAVGPAIGLNDSKMKWIADTPEPGLARVGHLNGAR